MDLRYLYDLVAGRRRMIGLMCLSAVLTATIMTFLLSETYRSMALVLVRPEKNLAIVAQNKEMLNFPVSYYTPVETTSKTYTEIIKSRFIAERIVRAIGTGALAGPRETGWRARLKRLKTGAKDLLKKTWTFLKYGRIEDEDPFAAAVSEVQGALSVKPTKDTFLFELHSEAKAAELSSIIANTASVVFVEYLRELKRLEKDNARESGSRNIQQAREEVDRRQQAVVDYKRQSGVVSPKKEVDLELEMLAGLQSSYVDLAKRLHGSRAKLSEVTQQLSEYSKFSRTQTKRAENPIAVYLKSQLAQKEVELVGLSKKFAPEHRDVVALKAQVDELKSRIANESPILESEETSSLDPIYHSLVGEQVKAKTDVQMLKAEMEKTAAEIESKKARIARLPKSAADLAMLETLVDLDQESFKLLSKHNEELDLEAEKDAPLIEVVQKAVPPRYPARPIKIYHAAFAGILSLLLGIGFALIAENLNDTVRNADEAERAFSLPVLATIPTIRALEGGKSDPDSRNG